ncbi:hypothetical protein [Sorangium cellulosum]|uniref:hypothetical protein n=1 Tax=Sorangium cellulosum TaxID=56 RepID=UPI001E2DD9BA|nr:hypothetical protein [Sorangium cellulosum]
MSSIISIVWGPAPAPVDAVVLADDEVAAASVVPVLAVVVDGSTVPEEEVVLPALPEPPAPPLPPPSSPLAHAATASPQTAKPKARKKILVFIRSHLRIYVILISARSGPDVD